MSETVMKTGEEWLRITLLSHPKGLMISVKSHPLVEDFMRGLSGGKSAPITDVGRFSQWEPIDDTQKLSYYQFGAPVREENHTNYTISSISTNLVDGDGRINLSFLTLVGIGHEELRFLSTKEVYPLNYRRELKVRIANAFREFVREYIKPVKITLIMTSLEL